MRPPQGSSIRDAVRSSIGLLPKALRRRVAFAVGLSVILAAVEAAAVAGLFSVIRVVANDRVDPPGWSHLVFASNRNQFAARAGAIVFALLLLRSALGFLAARMQARLHADTDEWLGGQIFARAVRYPYSTHLRRSSAEIITVLQLCTADVAANLIGATASASVDILMLLALGSALVVLQPLLALTMIVYFIVVAAVLLLAVSPAVRRAADEEHEASISASRSVMEGLHGVKAFQAAAATEVVSDEHAHHRSQLGLARRKKVFLAAASRQTLETSVTLGVGLLAGALFALQSTGEALASLGLVVAVAFRALPSLTRLLGTLNGMRSASVSLGRVRDELNERTTHDQSAPQPSPVFKHAIEFRDVSFTYGRSAVDAAALDGVSFSVPFGSSLGIVGSSGAGKTTLVDLLLGLLEPTGGSIEVDGTAVVPENVLAWRGLVGYVPQEVFLLDRSIRDNVVFGKRGGPADDDEVWDALDQAELSHFVQSLPDRLDTVIGERGARISGGQRQRLGVARALHRRPSLLVLDEATSSLDLATEAAMAETLESLDRSITKVIIAHRLTAVRTCDSIMFLKHGRVAGIGTFDQLVADVPDFSVLAILSAASSVEQRGLR